MKYFDSVRIKKLIINWEKNNFTYAYDKNSYKNDIKNQ